MPLKSAFVNVMERAARKAGRGLIRDFGEVEQLQVSPKGPGDFAAAAQTKSARTLREELARARPDFGLLTRDAAETEGPDSEHRWIVAPLDGAENFLHGVPCFSISIAVERNTLSAGRIRHETLAGLVYNPLTDETYWADKAQGAYLNDRRMRVSGRRNLNHALLGIGGPIRGGTGRRLFLSRAAELLSSAGGLRLLGSAALDLAYVASGRFDGCWQEGLEPWSLAAGIMLVREAGGFVSERDGGPGMMASGSVVAANDHLHEALLGALKPTESSPA